MGSSPVGEWPAAGMRFNQVNQPGADPSACANGKTQGGGGPMRHRAVITILRFAGSTRSEARAGPRACRTKVTECTRRLRSWSFSGRASALVQGSKRSTVPDNDMTRIIQRRGFQKKDMEPRFLPASRPRTPLRPVLPTETRRLALPSQLTLERQPASLLSRVRTALLKAAPRRRPAPQLLSRRRN